VSRENELAAEALQVDTNEVDQELYYDYEGRFIKQKIERDRLNLLPRVVSPALFATGGHALGDARVFERFTVGPVSGLTCRFLTLEAGASTGTVRRLPTLLAYVLEGSGVSVQDGVEHPFTAGDAVFVPPYVTHEIIAGADGLRAWIPENRLWHVLGLLGEEHFTPQPMPGEVELLLDDDDNWTGYRFMTGTLGTKKSIVVQKGAEERAERAFGRRRDAGRAAPPGDTVYHGMLRRLDEERALERATPRVIPGESLRWEDTRQGLLKYYVHNWSPVHGHDLDLAAYRIPPGGHTGRHRHVAEELLYVVRGSGYDVHGETSYRWKAGDLICVPPMTAHQHFADGDEEALLVTCWGTATANEWLGGIEHLANASTWSE
jgi:quercetin dioxygenase-like cupin family protein